MGIFVDGEYNTNEIVRFVILNKPKFTRLYMNQLILVLILTIVILSISMISMAVRLFFIKNGNFVQTSIEKNKNMQKASITCPKHDEIRRYKKDSCTGCGCGK
ncbi:MAG: hypothetical protein ACOCWG_02290 [bacterium]